MRLLIREPRGRLRAAGSAVAGTAGMAAVISALITAALALAVVALPRYDVGFRARALDQRMAQAPPDATSIQVGAQGSVSAGEVPDALFEESALEMNSVFGQRLPMASDEAGWFSAQTDRQYATDAPAKARAATGPYLGLVYRSGLEQHARLVAGDMPGTVPVPRGTPNTTHQVAVSQVEATQFGLHVGSVLHTTGSLFELTLVVTGIVAPKDPESAYWTEDPSLWKPAFVPTGVVPAHWDGTVFLDGAGVDSLISPDPGVSPVQMSVKWVLPLALAGIDADHIRPIVEHTAAVVAENSVAQLGSPEDALLPNLIADANVASGLPGYMGPWLAAQDSIVAVLSLLLAGMAVIGAVTVLVAARLLMTRRETELVLRRARGQSVRQLVLRVGLGTAVVMVPAAVAGAALGRWLTPGPPTTLAWWLAGTVAAVSVLGPVVMVVARYRTANPSGEQGRARERSAGRYARLRRRIAEGSLIAVSVAGLVLLRQQGRPSQGAAIDAFPAAAPVLVAVPLAVFAPYVSVYVTRLARRGAGRRRGAAVFMGLAQADRPRPGAATAVFALVLALGLVSFGPMLRDAVARGKVDATWAAVGADAVVDSSKSDSGLTPDAQRALIAASHATTSVSAVATQATFPKKLPSYEFAAAVVDPGAYAVLLSGTPAPAPPRAFAVRPSAGAPVPVVTTQTLATELGASPVTLSLPKAAPLTVQVVGVMSSSALVSGDGDFVLVPAWAVRSTLVGTPNLLALRGSPLNESALKAAAAKAVTDAHVTLRSAALTDLPGASLQPGAYLILTLCTAIAGAFSVLILLLSLSLDARGRELLLTRLRCLGLDNRRVRAMTFVETLPTLLAAAVGGVVAAAAVAPLVGPQLDLSLFTGSPVAVPMRPGATQLGLPAAGLVAVAALTLLAHTALTRRRGLTRALRTGDW
jgi:putative ABC transport system permease protein